MKKKPIGLHDALNDVKATAECYFKLKEEYSSIVSEQ